MQRWRRGHLMVILPWTKERRFSLFWEWLDLRPGWSVSCVGGKAMVGFRPDSPGCFRSAEGSCWRWFLVDWHNHSLRNILSVVCKINGVGRENSRGHRDGPDMLGSWFRKMTVRLDCRSWDGYAGRNSKADHRPEVASWGKERKQSIPRMWAHD